MTNRRPRQEGMNAVKLTFIVVGAILGCLFMYAVANRPQGDDLKAKVDASLADWRRTHVNTPAPETRVDDWLIAAGYTAKVEGAGVFRCIGVAHVSVCSTPDDAK